MTDLAISPMKRIDELEKVMLASGHVIDQPLRHLFLPGLYVRVVASKIGSLVVTMVHKTRHPFFMLTGEISVKDFRSGEIRIMKAPEMGTTEIGTRRVIYTHQDAVWATVHANPDNIQDVKVLEDIIFERREWDDGRTTRERYIQLLDEQGTRNELSSTEYISMLELAEALAEMPAVAEMIELNELGAKELQ